jgi:adenine nucleotide transporter 17
VSEKKPIPFLQRFVFLDLFLFEHSYSGAIGGALSFGLTYPLTTISTRLQIQTKESKDPSDPTFYSGFLDALQKILTREGWKGLFPGVEGGVIATAATQGNSIDF